MLKHERPSLFMSTVWSHLVLTVKSHCAVTPSQKLPHGFCLCFFWKTEIQTPWWQGPVEWYHLASDNLSKPGQKAGRGEARDNPRHQSGTLPTWRDGRTGGEKAKSEEKQMRGQIRDKENVTSEQNRRWYQFAENTAWLQHYSTLLQLWELQLQEVIKF